MLSSLVGCLVGKKSQRLIDVRTFLAQNMWSKSFQKQQFHHKQENDTESIFEGETFSSDRTLLKFAFLIGRKWENKRECCKFLFHLHFIRSHMRDRKN